MKGNFGGDFWRGFATSGISLVHSTFIDSALYGISIDDFLIDPKYQRRLVILLMLGSSSFIERGNSILRLTFLYHQRRMTNGLLSAKLTIRCCSKVVVLHALKKVIHEARIVKQTDSTSKRLKTISLVEKLMAADGE